MPKNQDPPYTVCVPNGLFDEPVSQHFDPAAAIQACREGMYVVAADQNAQELLDAEEANPSNYRDPFEVYHFGENKIYQNLVTQNYRVGLPTSIEPWGNEEKIHHCGPRGDLAYGQVIIRRTRGLPEPISDPAAVIFWHFITAQYRDVRHSAIQQVWEDYTKRGGVPVEPAPVDIKSAELAFWLHCNESRKACILLESLKTCRSISVFCPQETCFHPDAATFVGEVFTRHANPETVMVSGIYLSALSTDEGGEKAALALVKLFEERPYLLVDDWPSGLDRESPLVGPVQAPATSLSQTRRGLPYASNTTFPSPSRAKYRTSSARSLFGGFLALPLFPECLERFAFTGPSGPQKHSRPYPKW